ncbi:alanine:cation symporter family protein [Nitriliruptoraceae bacterium ZYF776]|nr:alanine:cation symporter family protein [Profundirhabdus halotolerans]
MSNHTSSEALLAQSFGDVVGDVGGFVWGPLLLIPLLLLTGLYLTIVLRGLQFRTLVRAMRLAFVHRDEADAEGDISHYQALTTALAATIGVGNIAGVATAIHFGGPGALFWMWVTGLVGMATKYAEAFLGVRFRRREADGKQNGGPHLYLRDGVGGGFGKALGVMFAAFAVLASFGIGNGSQANTVAGALEDQFGVAPGLTGAVLVVGAALVILGGITAIGRFTAAFVPLMAVTYMVAASVVLAANASELPDAIGLIFSSAFSGEAVAGGGAAVAFLTILRYGVARGIFSNESGLGTGAIAAAAARTTSPVRQALVSMTQTFLDTIVVVTFTGLVIVTTGAWENELEGADKTSAAFSMGLPGEWGGAIVAISVVFFAFSTLLGWSYYGERSITHLAGDKAVTPYRLVFLVVIFVGAMADLEVVWDLSDIANGLMALPNLIGLLILSPMVVRETRAYLADPETRLRERAGGR